MNVTQHLAEGFLETVDEKREQTAGEVSRSYWLPPPSPSSVNPETCQETFEACSEVYYSCLTHKEGSSDSCRVHYYQSMRVKLTQLKDADLIPSNTQEKPQKTNTRGLKLCTTKTSIKHPVLTKAF